VMNVLYDLGPVFVWTDNDVDFFVSCDDYLIADYDDFDDAVDCANDVYNDMIGSGVV